MLNVWKNLVYDLNQKQVGLCLVKISRPFANNEKTHAVSRI